MGTLCVVSGHIVCFFPLFSIFILSQCTLYCYAICQIKYYYTIIPHLLNTLDTKKHALIRYVKHISTIIIMRDRIYLLIEVFYN